MMPLISHRSHGTLPPPTHTLARQESPTLRPLKTCSNLFTWTSPYKDHPLPLWEQLEREWLAFDGKAFSIELIVKYIESLIWQRNLTSDVNHSNKIFCVQHFSVVLRSFIVGNILQGRTAVPWCEKLGSRKISAKRKAISTAKSSFKQHVSF